MTIQADVIAALGTGPKTKREIISECGAVVGGVNSALQRLKSRGVIAYDNASLRWRLVEAASESRAMYLTRRWHRLQVEIMKVETELDSLG